MAITLKSIRTALVAWGSHTQIVRAGARRTVAVLEPRGVPIEHTIASLYSFRRLRICYERRLYIHGAFIKLDFMIHDSSARALWQSHETHFD